MNVEWQQLIGFYQVAKRASFTKAAAATLRTQSALSQQVKALEEEFQCPLFERIGKRRVRLTAAGERFLRFAETVLGEFEQLGEDLEQFNGLPRGRLRLAAPFTTLYHLFPDALKAYSRRFPHVQLSLLDRSRAGVIRLVREGEVDFGLILESEVPRDLVFTRWIQVETMLMTPPDHPLTRLQEIRPEDICRFPLILPPRDAGHSCRHRLEQMCRSRGLECRVVMESSNVELSALYVQTGLGISFATVVTDLPALQHRQLAFLSAADLFDVDHIAVLQRKDKILSPHKQAFLDGLPAAWGHFSRGGIP